MKEFNIGGNLLYIPEVVLHSNVGDGKHNEVLLTSVWPGMRPPYDCVSGDEHIRASGEFYMTIYVRQLDDENKPAKQLQNYLHYNNEFLPPQQQYGTRFLKSLSKKTMDVYVVEKIGDVFRYIFCESNESIKSPACTMVSSTGTLLLSINFPKSYIEHWSELDIRSKEFVLQFSSNGEH